MRFSFTSVTRLTLEHKPGMTKSEHVSTDLFLDVSSGLDKKTYIDSNDLPTEKGSEMVTQTLIQGLVANIHKAHHEKWRDSAEHLRYVISELERGFASVATVKTGKWSDKS